ncbi:hypothetical protein SAMN05421766_1153 [Zobellia uliginosa]|uniref:Uncharacterized protein n=1 Tax=Zobellia uliginosa TaxID=143224 RepID=A0ABY1L238_9FLAO|nr:hypothetical protein SAMN05421766_1153 [Zobellia uliginosa]
MNDLVFVFFCIGITIFLIGMVVMLPKILFSSGFKSEDKKKRKRNSRDESGQSKESLTS